MFTFIGVASHTSTKSILEYLRRCGAEVCELDAPIAARAGMVVVVPSIKGSWQNGESRLGTPSELRSIGYQVPDWVLGASFCIAFRDRRRTNPCPHPFDSIQAWLRHVHEEVKRHCDELRDSIAA